MTAGSRCRLLLAAAAPALPLAVAAFLPSARPLPFEVCLLHMLTGLPCLTCGLTRSVCSLVQGDLAASLTFHPAGALVVIGLALHALWRGGEALRGRDLARRTLTRLTAGLGAMGAILSAGVWISRIAQV